MPTSHDNINIGGSKADFLRMVDNYAKRHETGDEVIAAPATLQIANALLYDSQKRSDKYTRDKRREFKSWALAKDTLEGLIQDLDSDNPTVSRLLKAQVEHLPEEIGKAVASMIEQIAPRLYANPNEPIAKTEEFNRLKALAHSLIDKYRRKLDGYARTCEEIELLIAVAKPMGETKEEGSSIDGYSKLLDKIQEGQPRKSPDRLPSALEIIAEEAELALGNATESLTFSERHTTPVAAMLYVLYSEAPEKRAAIVGELKNYEQRLGELVPAFIKAGVQDTPHMLRYMARLNEIVTKMANPILVSYAETIAQGSINTEQNPPPTKTN